jgi:hypothetical protein
MDSVKRDYTMSDSDLCMFASNLVIFIFWWSLGWGVKLIINYELWMVALPLGCANHSYGF